jgi:hypothetical protein
MSTRVLGPKGSKRRKRFLLVPILLVACTALFLIGSAQAVHDLEFQLDGNALSTVCGTTPDGNCTTQVFDWGRPSGSSDANYLFNANRTVNTSVVNSANSTGFTAAAFQRDFGLKVSAADNCSLTSTDATKPFCTADTTTFATGSKDIQNISGGGADNSGNWQCNKDNNVNSKIDITNAYSASYTVSGGDRIMYFAMEKNKDNGNNNAGFWFLQGDANCVSTGSAVNFTGNHRNGDILVTSAFTSGGPAVPTAASTRTRPRLLPATSSRSAPGATARPLRLPRLLLRSTRSVGRPTRGHCPPTRTSRFRG